MRTAEAFADEWLEGRWPAVHVPVQVFGDRLRLEVRLAAPFLDLEAPFLDVDRLAIVLEQAAGHDLVRQDVVLVSAGAEAAESADLIDAVIALECLNHGPAFGNEASSRLL